MNSLWLMLAIGVTGCNKLDSIMNKPYVTYKVNGEIVECRMEAMNNCGIHLWDCKDGSSYRCLYNVEVIKK